MTTRCGKCKGYVSWTPLLERTSVPPKTEWCTCAEPEEDWEYIEELDRRAFGVKEGEPI